MIKEDDGRDALKFFARASEIRKEEKIYTPQTVKELRDIVPTLTYARGAENPMLAKLYNEYGVSQDIFNKSLDLYKNGTLKEQKEYDNIPSVVVNLFDLAPKDEKNKGYYLVKLPASDPRGLILGHITSCCQLITGDSEQCVIDGMNLPDNGFYVLVKANTKEFNSSNINWNNFENDGKIVAQSYVWRSATGNITCDSVEVGDGSKNTVELPIRQALEQMGVKMAEQDPHIERVTVGLGGGTGKIISLQNLTLSTETEEMYIGYNYGDAKRQAEVFTHPDPKAQRTKLLNKLESEKIITTEDAVSLTIMIDDKEFKPLTGPAAIYTYKSGATFADLKDLEPDKIKFLVSNKDVINTLAQYKIELEESRSREVIHKEAIDIAKNIMPHAKFYALESPSLPPKGGPSSNVDGGRGGAHR